MDKKLEILWDGRVPGLAEHRISIGAFGEPLILLLTAYRRIATSMLAQATRDTGRLRTPATLIDLELEEIKEGSGGISAVCVMHAPPGTNIDLFETLTSRASEGLLADIEAEAHGEFRNTAVRNYLRALPPGVTGQKYAFTMNGHKREIAIGSMQLPEGPAELPLLHERIYAIVGVGFEPGDSYVRFKGVDETVQCEATVDQVTKALELRFGSVYAFIVRIGRKARLLRLRRAGEDLPRLSSDQEEEILFGRWDGLLRRLSN